MIAISRTLTIGLSAYLMQLELSIDGSCEHPAALKQYLMHDIRPGLAEVAERCTTLAAGRAVAGLDLGYRYPRAGLTRRMVDWHLRRQIRIARRDLQQIGAIVECLAAQIGRVPPPGCMQLKDTRLAAGMAAFDLAHRILPRSRRREAGSVEFLCHDPHYRSGTFRSIHDICGRADWLYA